MPVAKFIIEDDIVDERKYRKWDIITKFAMFAIALLVAQTTWLSNGDNLRSPWLSLGKTWGDRSRTETC